MSQISRTLQDTITSLSPAEVLASAKRFFSRRNSIYSAFIDMEGPTFVSFRGQGGEEIVIGVAEQNGATRVTGSSYLFDQQVARFLSTLPTATQLAPAQNPDVIPEIADALAEVGEKTA
jgi:hypothetical protein